MKYIHYNSLPNSSMTKKGHQMGISEDVIDEIDVQFDDGEFIIQLIENIGIQLQIFDDCFNHLENPIFKELAKLQTKTNKKNISIQQVIKALEKAGAVCKNNEVR